MQYGTYVNVSICATQTKLAMCVYISNMIDYSFSIAFTPMRVKQDEISLRLHKELESLATDDEIIQFVLIGICVGLVIISSVVIVPIFIRVIKSKSFVFRIFSYIEEKEIKKIIHNCQKLDLKNLRYKKKWLEKSAGDQEVFWKKLVAENSCKNDKRFKRQNNDDFTSFVEGKKKKTELVSDDIDEEERKKAKADSKARKAIDDSIDGTPREDNDDKNNYDETEGKAKTKGQAGKEEKAGKAEKGWKSKNKKGGKKEEEKEDLQETAVRNAALDAEIKKERRIGTLSEIE